MKSAENIEKTRAVVAELYKNGSDNAELGLILDMCDELIKLSGRVEALELANQPPLTHFGGPSGNPRGKKAHL